MFILSLLNCAINCLFACDKREEVVIVFFSVCIWFMSFCVRFRYDPSTQGAINFVPKSLKNVVVIKCKCRLFYVNEYGDKIALWHDMSNSCIFLGVISCKGWEVVCIGIYWDLWGCRWSKSCFEKSQKSCFDKLCETV